jgi:hypothetical protein
MMVNKEVFICKFDNTLECSSYLCEEDCSQLEMYEEMGKTCPLFAKSEKLDLAVHKVGKILFPHLDLLKINRQKEGTYKIVLTYEEIKNLREIWGKKL